MSADTTRKPRIPIGVDSFREICDGGYCYVDKTLFIKEVLDAGSKVTLFTRPRRFGKSLNMDMLRVFFEKSDEDTSWCFRDKKIWEQGTEYTDKQGQYPVIGLSFANVKTGSWESSYDKMRMGLQREYRQQRRRIDKSTLDPGDMERMNAFIDGSPSRTLVEDSLLDLSEILHAAYGARPIILIDEYDTPIGDAWESRDHGYYKEMIRFMRNLLMPALKGNVHLLFACMTGILRVAKENLFSGLNNVKVDGVLDTRYDECFGFTPQEVKDLIAMYGVDEEKYVEVAKWYEGYRFGTQEVFNPWSVLMYLDDGCRPKAYWSNTSEKGALGEVLLRGNAQFLEGLESLLGGGAVWTPISDTLAYSDLIRENVSENAYTLLLMSGYLTTTGRTSGNDDFMQWELKIPNWELEKVYPREILGAIPKGFNENLCAAIQKAITDKRPAELEDALTNLLRNSASYFDLESEKEYHTWLLGLLASMPGYRVTSNREAGEGRYDICLKPQAAHLPGILIEVKHEKNKEALDETMKELAIEAIGQIRRKHYADELRADGIFSILEFGIAFRVKTAYVVTGNDVPETEE